MTRIIRRYFDIILYSFLSWLILSFSLEVPFVSEFIKKWCDFQGTLNTAATSLIYFSSGVLTKTILINSGDCNYNHNYFNEERYIIKDGLSLESIGWFDLKLKIKQLIINPPLRISILLYFTLIYLTNNISLFSYLTIEIACYLLGLNTPQFVISIKSSLAKNITLFQDSETTDINDWFQDEKPITLLSQDRLNREQLVNRLCIVITSKIKSDTRGIAIIGPFGIGKSSIINMTLTELQMTHHNFIPCKIDTWGTYSSEEQIQKYFLEQIIKSLGKITSTTRLSGLPSKYINALKGVKSLWLDVLPLFDNQSSPDSQLSEIDALLSMLDLRIILIIEDLDRNKDASSMLNSIAPLIDRLNHNSNFRLVLSIGEKIDSPEITNRICRYKEYLHFNHDDIFSTIHSSVRKLINNSKCIYLGDIDSFFTKTDPVHKQARSYLFSYVTNPRDLKLLIREFCFDWTNILKGNCDIIDLLAITILKHYEPSLITLISKAKGSITNDIDKLTSNVNFENPIAARYLLSYFFIKNEMHEKERAQCCSSFPHQYINVLLERKVIYKYGVPQEDVYFRLAKKIKEKCLDETNSKIASTIASMLNVMCDIKSRGKAIIDLKNIYDEALIPVLASFYDELQRVKDGDFSTPYEKYNMDMTFSINLSANLTLTKKMLEEIVSILLPISIFFVLRFYKIAKDNSSLNLKELFKPSIDEILMQVQAQACLEDGTFNKDILYPSFALMSTLYDDKVDFFMGWLITADQKVKDGTINYINNYDGYPAEINLFVNTMKSYISLNR